MCWLCAVCAMCAVCACVCVLCVLVVCCVWVAVRIEVTEQQERAEHALRQLVKCTSSVCGCWLWGCVLVVCITANIGLVLCALCVWCVCVLCAYCVCGVCVVCVYCVCDVLSGLRFTEQQKWAEQVPRKPVQLACFIVYTPIKICFYIMHNIT